MCPLTFAEENAMIPRADVCVLYVGDVPLHTQDAIKRGMERMLAEDNPRGGPDVTIIWTNWSRHVMQCASGRRLELVLIANEPRTSPCYMTAWFGSLVNSLAARSDAPLVMFADDSLGDLRQMLRSRLVVITEGCVIDALRRRWEIPATVPSG